MSMSNQIKHRHQTGKSGPYRLLGILLLYIVYTVAAAHPLHAIEKRDGIYQISSASDLAAFAHLVNDGEVMARGRLLSDIDFTGYDEMIGLGDGLASAVNPFRGTFDGEGHTVTVAYNSTKSFTALFRFVDSATIRNLHVNGIVQSSVGHAAGVAGHVTGSCRFENILSSVRLVSTASGFVGNGGIVA